MKTKLLTLLLALAMTLSLAACGGKDTPASGSASSGSAQTEESSSAAASAPDTSVEEPEEEETDSAEEEQAAVPETKPEEKPAQQKPAQQKPEEQKPAQSGSAPGSGSSSANTGSSPAQPESTGVDLTAFYESQAAAFGENFPAMMAMDGEALGAFYPGLAELSPKQCLVTMPMISAVAAEFALVEVASADQVESVKAIFQSRVDYQLEQGAFYPATAEAWENNVRIVSSGNYVMMVCFSECDAVVSSFNALF